MDREGYHTHPQVVHTSLERLLKTTRTLDTRAYDYRLSAIVLPPHPIEKKREEITFPPGVHGHHEATGLFSSYILSLT